MEFNQKVLPKWAALEALAGDPKRLALVAADLVAHVEKRSETIGARRWSSPTICRTRPCERFSSRRNFSDLTGA